MGVIMSETVQAEADVETEENIFEGYSNRLMSLKEVVERISQLGLAKANGPNRRFMLSHLREGTLKATGLVKLSKPIEMRIDIPNIIWSQSDYSEFKNVTGYSIDLATLFEKCNAETGDKYKVKIKECPDYKDLDNDKFNEEIKDIEVEINVGQHDWLQFIQLNEVKNNIKHDNQEGTSENEDKGPGRPPSDKWTEALKLLIKAIFSVASKEKDINIVLNKVLNKYDSYLEEINEFKEKNKKTTYPQRSGMSKILMKLKK